jgi:nicotinamide riboside transporter PnuC
MDVNPFGMTANLIDACFLILGKGGKILNARGNRICFIFDSICLTYWLFMNVRRGLYSQATSCIVSICLCVYGWIKWGKTKPGKI